MPVRARPRAPLNLMNVSKIIDHRRRSGNETNYCHSQGFENNLLSQLNLCTDLVANLREKTGYLNYRFYEDIIAHDVFIFVKGSNDPVEFTFCFKQSDYSYFIRLVIKLFVFGSSIETHYKVKLCSRRFTTCGRRFSWRHKDIYPC